MKVSSLNHGSTNFAPTKEEVFVNFPMGNEVTTHFECVSTSSTFPQSLSDIESKLQDVEEEGTAKGKFFQGADFPQASPFCSAKGSSDNEWFGSREQESGETSKGKLIHETDFPQVSPSCSINDPAVSGKVEVELWAAQKQEEKEEEKVFIEEEKPRIDVGPDEKVEEETRKRLAFLRRMVNVVGDALTAMGCANQQTASKHAVAKGEFEGKTLPAISITEYLWRMVENLEAWTPVQRNDFESMSIALRVTVIALIYLDRAVSANSSKLSLTMWNSHRLLLVAFLIAVKFTEDMPIGNEVWASVGGVPVKELFNLEMKFLQLIDYNLHLGPGQFEVALNRVVRMLCTEEKK